MSGQKDGIYSMKLDGSIFRCQAPFPAKKEYSLLIARALHGESFVLPEVTY